MGKKAKELKEKNLNNLKEKIKKGKKEPPKEDSVKRQKNTNKVEDSHEEASRNKDTSTNKSREKSNSYNKSTSQDTITLPKKNKKNDLELKSYHIKNDYIEKIDNISDNTDYYKYELVNMALGIFFDKLEDDY